MLELSPLILLSLPRAAVVSCTVALLYDTSVSSHRTQIRGGLVGVCELQDTFRAHPYLDGIRGCWEGGEPVSRDMMVLRLLATSGKGSVTALWWINDDTVL